MDFEMKHVISKTLLMLKNPFKELFRSLLGGNRLKIYLTFFLAILGFFLDFLPGFLYQTFFLLVSRNCS